MTMASSSPCHSEGYIQLQHEDPMGHGHGLIVVALLHQELLPSIGMVQLLGVTTHHGVEEGLGWETVRQESDPSIYLSIHPSIYLSMYKCLYNYIYTHLYMYIYIYTYKQMIRYLVCVYYYVYLRYL